MVDLARVLVQLATVLLVEPFQPVAGEGKLVVVNGLVRLAEIRQQLVVLTVQLQCHLDHAKIGVGKFELHGPPTHERVLILNVRQVMGGGPFQVIDTVLHV